MCSLPTCVQHSNAILEMGKISKAAVSTDPREGLPVPGVKKDKEYSPAAVQVIPDTVEKRESPGPSSMEDQVAATGKKMEAPVVVSRTISPPQSSCKNCVLQLEPAPVKSGEVSTFSRQPQKAVGRTAAVAAVESLATAAETREKSAEQVRSWRREYSSLWAATPAVSGVASSVESISCIPSATPSPAMLNGQVGVTGSVATALGSGLPSEEVGLGWGASEIDTQRQLRHQVVASSFSHPHTMDCSMMSATGPVSETHPSPPMFSEGFIPTKSSLWGEGAMLDGAPIGGPYRGTAVTAASLSRGSMGGDTFHGNYGLNGDVTSAGCDQISAGDMTADPLLFNLRLSQARSAGLWASTSLGSAEGRDSIWTTPSNKQFQGSAIAAHIALSEGRSFDTNASLDSYVQDTKHEQWQEAVPVNAPLQDSSAMHKTASAADAVGDASLAIGGEEIATRMWEETLLPSPKGGGLYSPRDLTGLQSSSRWALEPPSRPSSAASAPGITSGTFQRGQVVTCNAPSIRYSDPRATFDVPALPGISSTMPAVARMAVAATSPAPPVASLSFTPTGAWPTMMASDGDGGPRAPLCFPSTLSTTLTDLNSALAAPIATISSSAAFSGSSDLNTKGNGRIVMSSGNGSQRGVLASDGGQEDLEGMMDLWKLVGSEDPLK